MLGPLVSLVSLLLGAGAELAPIPLQRGRTTTVQVMPDVGAPLERAVPSRAFTRAVALDADRRWAEAAALYEEAAVEWSTAARLRPAPALERAVLKARRERQRSLILASTVPTRGRFESVVTSIAPLEEADLLRDKLLVVRATTGRAPAGLYARARDAIEALLRAPTPRGPDADAELHLLLCATHGAAGVRAAARLALAHVSEAQRRDPDHALPHALCAAALDERDEALADLEILALRPAPHQLDPFRLRELYLANDWDRLRGDPRFETLFPPPPP